jgi:hypothetical protein
VENANEKKGNLVNKGDKKDEKKREQEESKKYNIKGGGKR